MAAEKCMICLIEAMDSLWFHQIVLLSQPSSFLASEDAKKESESIKNSSNHSLPSQEFSPLVYDDVSSQEESDDTDTETETETRPTRLNLIATKARAHSSSPISSRKRSRNYNRLQKSMSSKRVLDLELEEVKGFMDLGFLFKKENLTKPIINLVPGLQWIGGGDDDDDERKEIMGPYLSEAWDVRRPDSPLMKLRIGRVASAADMKKHLKFWAHTVVASLVHQES